MSKFRSLWKMPALLAGMSVLAGSTTVQAALSKSQGTGSEPAGLIWVYFAAFVLGTLGLGFLPSKRKEVE